MILLLFMIMILIGLMDDGCIHCQSLQFKDEHNGMRCGNDKIVLKFYDFL